MDVYRKIENCFLINGCLVSDKEATDNSLMFISENINNLDKLEKFVDYIYGFKEGHKRLLSKILIQTSSTLLSNIAPETILAYKIIYSKIAKIISEIKSLSHDFELELNSTFLVAVSLDPAYFISNYSLFSDFIEINSLTFFFRYLCDHPVPSKEILETTILRYRETHGLHSKFIQFSSKAITMENNFLCAANSNHAQLNTLYCLKEFNSSLPILDNTNYSGGGFFIYWDSFGIVVDPGYNFLHHFFSKGFGVNSIDLILITHSHDDHCADLDTIYSLLSKYNSRNTNKHQILTFCSLNTYNKFNYINSPYSKQVLFPLLKNERKCDQANDILSERKFPFKIQSHLAFHNEYPLLGDSSLGVSIELNSEGYHRTILFSGDTAYNSELLNDYCVKTDISILNIGKVEENTNGYYHKHLGINGCIEILQHYILSGKSPSIALISEFGIEMTNHRVQIVDLIIKFLLKYNINLSSLPFSIFPSDNTLEISLTDLKLSSSDILKKDHTLVSCCEVNSKLFYR
ncbi:MAG: MBL fold metallo-hydrolase [Solidesulfovibrio sp.]|uniref:MBL fold metallo-hydrolase n=1 Tax=Solidesulfovibrio sp. TaxID=2910990 RepID=UPI003158C6E8